MIHFLGWRDRHETKAEVFNYQQINKMETINSIRQFQTKAPLWLKQKTRHTKNCLKL